MTARWPRGDPEDGPWQRRVTYNGPYKMAPRGPARRRNKAGYPIYPAWGRSGADHLGLIILQELRTFVGLYAPQRAGIYLVEDDA